MEINKIRKINKAIFITFVVASITSMIYSAIQIGIDNHLIGDSDISEVHLEGFTIENKTLDIENRNIQTDLIFRLNNTGLFDIEIYEARVIMIFNLSIYFLENIQLSQLFNLTIDVPTPIIIPKNTASNITINVSGGMGDRIEVLIDNLNQTQLMIPNDLKASSNISISRVVYVFDFNYFIVGAKLKGEINFDG